VQTCIYCGWENPAGWRFCGQCGSSHDVSSLVVGDDRDAVLRKLASYIPEHLADSILHRSRGRLEGERRQVTILFADVSGFTALAEKRDPEEVFVFMNECLSLLVDRIYTFEGTVNKFIGDGVMALFGAPIAHENDPERAVRAALAMREALAKMNRERAAAGVDLRLRIGIHTGEVVAGSMGSDQRMDYTVMGDAVNVAARLQTLANIDAILVSQAVYQSTRPIFDFAPAGPQWIRGRSEPVETYEVVGEKAQPGPVRGLEGLRAPLIGRDQELARLRQVAQELLTAGRGAIVTLSGEAGLGKSRLTGEFKQQLDRSAVNILEGHCLPYTAGVGYSVFLDLFRRYFHLMPGESDEVRQDRLLTALEALRFSRPEEVIPYFFALLSVPAPRADWRTRLALLNPIQLKEQIFAAVRQFILALARQQPLILIFEDVHWVDALSLELIISLLDIATSAPVVFYVISRLGPEPGCTRVPEVAARDFPAVHVPVTLQALSEADATTLVEALLVIADLPMRVEALIVNRAEGNPFYLEEVIRALIDRQLIQRVGLLWQATSPAELDTLSVPTSLNGLIMARVDRLPQEWKETLQYASVIGRRFETELLRQVVSEELLPNFADIIHGLTTLGLLQSEAGPRPVVTFHHVLTQQAIYQSLLVRRRRQLHSRVGEALERLYPDAIDENLETLAYHFAEGEESERTLYYLVAAGQKAESRYAHEAALSYYQKAIDLDKRLPLPADMITERRRQMVTVHRGIGNIHYFAGEYGLAIRDYRQALRLGRHLYDRCWCANLYGQIGRCYERQGNYNRAIRWSTVGLKLIDSYDPDSCYPERATLYAHLGWIHFRRGDWEESFTWATRGLELLAGAGPSMELASLYNLMAGLYHQKGDRAGASEFARKNLTLRQQIGDSRGLATAYNNLGILALDEGNLDEAARYIEEGLRFRQNIGETEGLINSYTNLGMIMRVRGDLNRAATLFQQSLTLSQRSGHAWNISNALNNLGLVALLSGDLTQAKTYLDQSVALCRQTTARSHLAEGLYLSAQVALAQDELLSAENLAIEARNVARQERNLADEAGALRTLGMVYARQERTDAAIASLEESLRLALELSSRYETALCHLTLAQTLADARTKAVTIDEATPRLARARQHLTEALAIFRQLQAQADLARAEALWQTLQTLNPA